MADIGPFFGALIIGILVNITLYGVMIMQCYTYLTTCKRDRPFIKLFVLYLFVADTANTVFMAGALYDYLVGHFGDFEYIAKATWLALADPSLTGILSCSVQLFFAWRIKVLTGLIWPTMIIVAFAIASGLGGIGTAVAAGHWVPEWAELQKLKAIVIVWLAASAICDIMITAALVWTLKKKQTGFPVTDHLIQKIIRNTVQTGFLTAFVAFIDLVLFLSLTSDAHLALNVPLSKLYTNSLLSSLNARSGWQTSDMETQTPSALEMGNRRNTSSHSKSIPRVLLNLTSAASVSVVDPTSPYPSDVPDLQQNGPVVYESHAMKTRTPSQKLSHEASFEDQDKNDGTRGALNDTATDSCSVFSQPKGRYEETV